MPADLTGKVAAVITKADRPNKNPLFKFIRTREAALHNWEVLWRFNNLGEVIRANKDTIVQYGSEFRPVNELTMLFKNHPLWPWMRQALEDGSSFPLKKNVSRLKYLDAAEGLCFGNRKGCLLHSKFLEACLDEDVHHGFSLPLPREKVLEIQDLLIAPLNVHNQNIINKWGEIISKKRMTHNLSKVFLASGMSFNSRTIKTLLQECMYGYCLLRMIHTIVDLRERHPNRRIFLSKWACQNGNGSQNTANCIITSKHLSRPPPCTAT